MMKLCNWCNTFLDISEFYREKHGKYGVKGTCKNCCNKKHRLYYLNNLHKVRKQNRIKKRKCYKNNPEKIKTQIKSFRKTKKGKELRKREKIKYKSLYPEKIKAHQKLNDLFKYNNIDKDFICGICGKQPVQKHHENYELWYSFIPLCIEHHNEIHNIKGE